MKNIFLLPMCSVLVAFLLALATHLQADTNAPAGVDAKSKEVLTKLLNSLKTAKSAEAGIKMSMEISLPGLPPQHMSGDYSFAMQRPNKLAMVLTNGMMGATVISDGTNQLTHLPMLKKYTLTPAGKDLMSATPGGDAESMAGTMGSLGLLGAIFNTNGYEGFIDGIPSALYKGVEKIGSRSSHHIVLSTDSGELDMYVDAGAKPILHRWSMDMAKLLDNEALSNSPEALEAMKKSKMLMSMTFTNWVLNAKLATNRFTITIPQTAAKVSSFSEAAKGVHAEELDEEDKIPDLTNKEAPAFKLDLVDGGELELSRLKDQSAIVLTFWNTKAAPAAKALPLLAALAKDYEAKGVVLYVVNEDQDKDEITAFLAKLRLKLNAVLDPDGKVGQLYGVRGVPHTVLINKKGIVHAVHIGYSPEMNSVLAPDLDKMLKN